MNRRAIRAQVLDIRRKARQCRGTTPALVVARDARNVGTLLGYSGTIKLNACGELIVVAEEVESREWNDRVTAEF